MKNSAKIDSYGAALKAYERASDSYGAARNRLERARAALHPGGGDSARALAAFTACEYALQEWGNRVDAASESLEEAFLSAGGVA